MEEAVLPTDGRSSVAVLPTDGRSSEAEAAEQKSNPSFGCLRSKGYALAKQKQRSMEAARSSNFT